MTMKFTNKIKMFTPDMRSGYLVILCSGFNR